MTKRCQSRGDLVNAVNVPLTVLVHDHQAVAALEPADLHRSRYRTVGSRCELNLERTGASGAASVVCAEVVGT